MRRGGLLCQISSFNDGSGKYPNGITWCKLSWLDADRDVWAKDQVAGVPVSKQHCVSKPYILTPEKT